EDNGQRHHAEVVGCQLLVAGGHPPEPLQAVDAPLHDVPPPVTLAIKPPLPRFLVLLVCDDRLDATLPQPLPQPPRGVRLVPGHLRRLLRPGRRLLQERNGPLRLMLLPGADRHRHRRPPGVADQVQLGAEAALAAAQGVVVRLAGRRFFFDAPAADWWARTTEPSMQNSCQSISPRFILRAWRWRRMRSQRPLQVQLRKRS